MATIIRAATLIGRVLTSNLTWAILCFFAALVMIFGIVPVLYVAGGIVLLMMWLAEI